MEYQKIRDILGNEVYKDDKGLEYLISWTSGKAVWIPLSE